MIDDDSGISPLGRLNEESALRTILEGTSNETGERFFAALVARRFGSTPLPLFSLGETDVLEHTFKDSGLLDIVVRPVNFRRHYSSTEQMIRRLKETAFLRAPIDKLDEGERKQAWAEIEHELSKLEGPNGVELPGEFLIAVGTK